MTALRRAIERRYFGWWVVSGAVTLQMLQAGLFMQAFGAYVAVWRTEFGWSATAIAGIYTAKQVINGVLAPFQGWLIERVGTQRVLTLGLAISGAALLALSTVRTTLAFALVFALLSMGLSFSGALPLATSIVQWFERRRATAMALMQEGTSLGGLLVPLATLAIVHYGWRDMVAVTGAAFIVLGLPISALFRRPAPLASAPKDEPGEAARQDFRAADALRTRAFWLLSLGHATALQVVASVTVYLVVYLVDGHGYTLALSGVVIGAMTLSLGIGQLLGGFVGDRFPKRRIASAAMVGHAVAMLLLGLAGSGRIFVFAFALVHGLSWGMRGPQMQALRADYFGARAFPQVMGLTVPLLTVGQVLGPLVVGTLRDATGSYDPGLAFLAAGALVGAVAFALARPPRPPRGSAAR